MSFSKPGDAGFEKDTFLMGITINYDEQMVIRQIR